MCIPIHKDLRLTLNESGEGVGYKLFYWRENKLKGIVQTARSYKTKKWLKSRSGPGYFLYRFKKEALADGWMFDEIKRVKFRGVGYQGKDVDGAQIIVAEEIFIPK